MDIFNHALNDTEDYQVGEAMTLEANSEESAGSSVPVSGEIHQNSHSLQPRDNNASASGNRDQSGHEEALEEQDDVPIKVGCGKDSFRTDQHPGEPSPGENARSKQKNDGQDEPRSRRIEDV